MCNKCTSPFRKSRKNGEFLYIYFYAELSPPSGKCSSPSVCIYMLKAVKRAAGATWSTLVPRVGLGPNTEPWPHPIERHYFALRII